MQIVSIEDKLHELSDPVLTSCMTCQILFSRKIIKYHKLSSAELSQRGVKIYLGKEVYCSHYWKYERSHTVVEPHDVFFLFYVP